MKYKIIIVSDKTEEREINTDEIKIIEKNKNEKVKDLLTEKEKNKQ